ncbi:cation transporter [Shewanella sp. Scap07]|uniref:HMA2 domain-containing protein n=1 Tax=Shewanella sp. Scap07 TaxID=2589987 RepID=UPI0015BF66F2|nr:heavy-metal-associated domain-containing protein [Shewanella sp. Scap07]QLE84442.1 cation transporter [Shewanella sp. Scap07]
MNKHIESALKLRRWVTIGHHIPGRIRLKYKLGILAQFASFNTGDIEQAVQKVPALKQYKINHSTGSVVIEYDPQQITPALIDALFAESEQAAREACHQISDRLTLNGADNE